MRNAQATLAVLIALTIVMIEVAALVSSASVDSYTNEKQAVQATQALLQVDSAIEEALYRLQLDANYAGGTVTLPSGELDIDITVVDPTTRNVVINTVDGQVHRTLSATVSVLGQTSNPLANYATFSLDRTRVQNDNTVVGDIWSNSYVDVRYNNALVQGDITALSSTSNTQVRDSARVEGDVTSIDRIRVRNSGYVEGTATSNEDVLVQSGGHVGTEVEYAGNSINNLSLPVFDYDTYKAQAQSEGTYYSSRNQFLNYLSLNGNTISGGVHYVDDTGTLTFPYGQSYNITGTIITKGQIRIYASGYTHTAENNLPALVTSNSIRFRDTTWCNCSADVTGVVYAEADVEINHDTHTEGGHAVQITGAAWAGDDIEILNKGTVTYNSGIVSAVQGFNFDADPILGGGSILDYAIWTADDYRTTLSNNHNAATYGNAWVGDTIDLWGYSTVHYGDIYTSGNNWGSPSIVEYGAKVLDNPNTASTEGNFYSIPEIWVRDYGSEVEDTASSANWVSVFYGGTVGTVDIDYDLEINNIPAPSFDYSTYRSQAASAGTLYNSTSSFLNYLNSQGGVISGGVYYIDSSGTLNLDSNANITGTIISEGRINIRSSSYIHTAENNLPALVSQDRIVFEDTGGWCNCTADVTGLVFAENDVQLYHDRYSGSQDYAVEITGAVWTLDDLDLGEYSRIIYDPDILDGIQGFGDLGEISGGGGVGLPGTDNLIEVLDWEID